jgi:hypothetical protein
MNKRAFLKLGGATALVGAVRPAVARAATDQPQIEGPDDFLSLVGEAMALLAGIGFGRYVSDVSDRIVAGESVPEHLSQMGYGWVLYPPDQAMRNTVVPIYVLWPVPARVSPIWAASVIAHEATHLHQFRRDPSLITDEVGPTSVQYAVESALTSRL